MKITETTVSRAEELLTEWGAVYADRDLRVLVALKSRIPKVRIAALSGLGKATVDRIEKRYAEDLAP